MFKRKEIEAEVSCVHTAVSEISLQKARELIDGNEQRFIELSKSYHQNLVTIAPEDHFAALKSYVQGIAEVGLGNMMITSYYSTTLNPTTLPFGFNSHMQSQILQCLNRLAADAIKPMVETVLLELAKSGNPDWFISRIDLLNDIYFGKRTREIYNFLFENFEKFRKFDKLLKSDRFRAEAAKSAEIDNKILLYIAERGKKYSRSALLGSIHQINDKDLRSTILNFLTTDPNPNIFTRSVVLLDTMSKKEQFRAYELSYERFHAQIAQMKEDVPTKILSILAKHGDVWIRKLVALYPGNHFQIPRILALDPDWGVRIYIRDRQFGLINVKENIREFETQIKEKINYFNGIPTSYQNAKNLKVIS